MRVCDVVGCEKKHRAKGLCSMHWQRMSKHGHLESTNMWGVPVVDRILAKVMKIENGCWIFTGNLGRTGYGKISNSGKTTLAYKVMYEAKHGLVPVGLELDHSCRRRNCVNPDHVEPVTHVENV